MFNPITIPYNCVMLFNIVHLKDEYTIDDAEEVIGEMCNTVKNEYKDSGGFIAGQVMKYSGFISDEGSVKTEDNEVENHIVIVTYWKSFEDHEKSHGDCLFKDKFNKLVDMSQETVELGYTLLWQGEPE